MENRVQEMSMRQPFSVLFLLLSVGADAQPYAVPRPDLRATIPLAPLSKAVSRLDAVAFEGELQFGVNCDVQVQIQGPVFSGDSWTRFVDGAGGFQGGLTTGVKAFTN